MNTKPTKTRYCLCGLAWGHTGKHRPKEAHIGVAIKEIDTGKLIEIWPYLMCEKALIAGDGEEVVRVIITEVKMPEIQIHCSKCHDSGCGECSKKTI